MRSAARRARPIPSKPFPMLEGMVRALESDKGVQPISSRARAEMDAAVATFKAARKLRQEFVKSGQLFAKSIMVSRKAFEHIVALDEAFRAANKARRMK